MRLAIIFVLVLLSGCDGVSKADISNAIKMCEGHHGLRDVISSSADSVDIYCDDGTQFPGTAKIKNAPDCQTIMDKKYCN